MEHFIVNTESKIVISCKTVGLSSGEYSFKHIAILACNDKIIDKTSIYYGNRTWEAFRYQMVIRKLIKKTKFFTDTEKETYLSKY